MSSRLLLKSKTSSSTQLLRKYRQSFSLGPLNRSLTNTGRSIEDDGYGHYKGESSSLWQKVVNRFQEDPNPGTLILVRHGESEWNNRELFTGWVDVDLNERGRREIEHAARLLLERGYTVDITYTSMLKRAIRSAWIILNELNQIYRPMVKSWRLNERMYGALEGRSKPGLAKIFGEEQVQRWRAGLVERPPPMPLDHPYYHGLERKYAHLLLARAQKENPKATDFQIPLTESLQDTLERTIPLWESHIMPDLKAGRNVMIVAHRNSLRGIVKHIDEMTAEQIQTVGIPNGIPLVYKFDKNMKPIPHRNAQPPLRGIWLERKGLLRAALDKEAELSSKIGHTIQEWSFSYAQQLHHSHPNYYGANGTNIISKQDNVLPVNTNFNHYPHVSQLANTQLKNNTKYYVDPTLAAVESTLTTKITPTIENTNNVSSSTASATTSAMIGDTIGGNLYSTPLLKSLAKLESERKLFDLIDENQRNTYQYPDAVAINTTGTGPASGNNIVEDEESKNGVAANQRNDVDEDTLLDMEVEKKKKLAEEDYRYYRPHHGFSPVLPSNLPLGDIFIDENVLNTAAFHSSSLLCDIRTSIDQHPHSEESDTEDFDFYQHIQHTINSTNSDNIIGNEINSPKSIRGSDKNANNSASHEEETEDMIINSTDPLVRRRLVYTKSGLWLRTDVSREDEIKKLQALHPELANNDITNPDLIDPYAHESLQDILTNFKNTNVHALEFKDRPQLIIIRHGKTEHNKLGLFTGWEDALLANEGREEAIHAGILLRKHGIEFDVVYTSWLSRAIETAWLVLNELDSIWVPVVKTWRLNERMYGALTGLSKKMIRQIYGDEQFMKWRRGFDTPPPPISSFSHAYPGNDMRYVNYVRDLDINIFETLIRSLAHKKLEIHRNFPKAESLKDCMDRTIPYFLNVISPESIKPGKNVLIASSENAIRGLLMHLCKISPDKIHSVEIPTGLPLVFDSQQGRIRLLEDDTWGPNFNPLLKYNFGTQPQLLFQIDNKILQDQNLPLQDPAWDNILVRKSNRSTDK